MEIKVKTLTGKTMILDTEPVAAAPIRGHGLCSCGSGTAYGACHGSVAKVGRNQPCPCGSGVKYKKCHGAYYAF